MPQHRLYGLRGKAYGRSVKALYQELGPAILEEYQRINAEKGKFTPIDLGSLCMKFRIPLTVMDDWLPELTEFEYRRSWDRIRESQLMGTNRRVKASDLGVIWSDD